MYFSYHVSQNLHNYTRHPGGGYRKFSKGIVIEDGTFLRPKGEGRGCRPQKVRNDLLISLQPRGRVASPYSPIRSANASFKSNVMMLFKSRLDNINLRGVIGSYSDIRGLQTARRIHFGFPLKSENLFLGLKTI